MMPAAFRRGSCPLLFSCGVSFQRRDHKRTELDHQQRRYGVTDRLREHTSLCVVTEVEPVRKSLKPCSLVWRNRPSALRMDVASLAHRAKSSRYRLGWLIPPETAVDGQIAVPPVAM